MKHRCRFTSRATVSLVVSTNQDLSLPVFSGVLATDATGLDAFSHALSGLVTNTTYYAQATAVNDQNATGVSALVSFAMLDPAPATGSARFAWRGCKSMAATAIFSDYGAGSSSAVLRFEASADGFETVAATADTAATPGASYTMAIDGLEPSTMYALRFRFVNEWGVVSYAAVDGTFETRAAPIASSGIGYRSSVDGTSVDFAFGVTQIFDGASLDATLVYDGRTIGTQPISAAGTLSWPGIPFAGRAATATVTVTGTLDGDAVSETWETVVRPGGSVRAVNDLSELRAVPVHPGDTIALPELEHEGEYYLPLDIRPFEIAADGITLVAREPGFTAVAVYRYNSVSGAIERDSAMGLAICAPRPTGPGRVFLAETGGANMNWSDPSKWRCLTDPTVADAYPDGVGDVAIVPLAKDKTLTLDVDATAGALYVGFDESAPASGSIRFAGSNKTLTFRTGEEGTPGTLRVTGLGRKDVLNALPHFYLGSSSSGSRLGLAIPDGLVLDAGKHPDFTDTTLRNTHNRIVFHNGYGLALNVPAGRTLRLCNFDHGWRDGADDQMGNCSNFIWGSGFPIVGEGTIVYEGPVGYFDSTLKDFAGTLVIRQRQRYDGCGISSRGGGFWLKANVGYEAKNAAFVLEGQVNYAGIGSSLGVATWGSTHGWGAWGPGDNSFGGRAMVLAGGTLLQRGNNDSWPNNGIPVNPNRSDALVVSNGFSRINMTDYLNSTPTNQMEFAELRHAGRGTLRVETTDVDRTGGTKPAVQSHLVLHGLRDHAIGAGGAFGSGRESIIPWIVCTAQWANRFYFPFPGESAGESDCLVRGLTHPASKASLAAADDPEENVFVSEKTISLESDVTVNSLCLNKNWSKGTALGAERKLTVTSGGVVLEGERCAIGQESDFMAGTAGTLVLPNEGYLYSTVQDSSKPNEVWAAIVAPKGLAISSPGYFRMGGDQTGIDEEIAVNGCDVTLGSSTTGCQIDVPVRLESGAAVLRIGKQGSFCGQILHINDHGTLGAKFVPAAGTTEPVQKFFIDGTSMPRGTYGSSASAAENKDDRHFSGTGMIQVLADELSGPEVANLALVTRDDRSATISFDLWPGYGADRVDVYALVPADGGDAVSTNLIYSSEAPADGRFEGTLAGLEPETSYTVRLLAVNQSRGEEFTAESPDELIFETLSFDETPLVVLESASETGSGDVTMPWLLVRAGSGRAIESIRLYWAESAAALDDLSSCTNVAVPAADFVPGNHETTLTGLRPGSSYYALLVARNDGAADNVCTSGPVAFATAAENRPGARPLVLGSCVRTPDEFTALVSAPAGEPAFPNVYAVWGALHGGEAVSGWDGSLRIGAMDATASFLTPTIPAAALGDAVYVRFVGIADGGKSSWSASYYLPDIPVVAEVPPKVGVSGIEPGGNDATLSAYVFNSGSLSENGLVDISLEYALDPDAFEPGSQAKVWSVPFATGATVGAVAAVRIGNLRAERRYYARFVGENDHNQRGAGDVFTFDTLAGDGGSVGASDWGLRQMRLSAGSGNADGLDAMVWDETKAVGVEGAVMAYRYNQTPWASDKSGASYVWGDNIGFFYKGWIFLENGKTYTIGSSIDDSCIVKIGDTEVLRQANWGAHPVFGVFSPDATSWYEFEVRMGNGGGGAGAGEDNNTFGLGWNTTGTQTVSASAMRPFLDPGDGSFLRPSADRTLTVVSTKLVSGGVSATVSFTAGLPAGTLRAFWGDEDCGTNATAWANSAENLASVTGAATETTVTIPVANPFATPYFRLALVGANGAALWSPLLLLDVSQTLLGAVSATTDGDRMTVSGAALSLGSGDGYALRLLWGYAADFSDAAVTNLSVAAAGAFAATVPVVPGTNGWWRLVATTADGGYDATLPAAFKTKAGSVLAATATSTMNHHDVTVSGNLDVLGAGVTTVTLWAGEDPEHMTAVGGASASAILDGTGPFSLTGTIPGQVPHSFSWKIVSVNVAPGGTAWTNETSVFTATTVDAATYTWKPEKTEGRWDDPANWEVSGVPDPNDVLGYPDNAAAKVRFVADTTATIAVTNAFAFKDMSLKYANLDVTFAGTNAATCKLTGDVTNVGNDQNDTTVVSGTHVVLSGVTLYDSSGAFNWATKTSEDCVLRLENGSVLSMDSYMHIFGTNTWIEVAERSEMVWRNRSTDGAGFDLCNFGGGVAVDDATFSTSWLTPQRHVGAVAEPQYILLSGETARLQVGCYYRTYDNNSDKMLNDVNFVFSVPLRGWRDPADAPVYAEYTRTADNKKFAYRSPVGEGKAVLSVDQHSPLLQSGHARTVQLLSWKAGIDTNNVTLVQGFAGGNPDAQKFATLYYTYGWPSTRKTKEGDELPTGVAARVTGLGGTIMILR